MTPQGPAVASDHIAIASCISCIKLLFGQEAENAADAPLLLPQNWGNNHRSYVALWISATKMNHQAMVELEMHQEQAAQEGTNEENQQQQDQEEGEAEGEESTGLGGGRRSVRRR